MMFRPSRIGLLAGIFLLLGTPAFVGAEDDPHRELLERRWQILGLKARKDVLTNERRILALAEQAEEKGLMPGKKPGVDLLAEYLHQEWLATKERRRIALIKANAPISENDAVKEKWEEESRENFKLEKRKKEAEEGIAMAKETPLWDRWTVLIGLGGLCLVGVSNLLGWHGRRRQIRSYARFSGKMGVASVALFVAVGLLAGISSAQDNVEMKEIAKLEREIRPLQEEADLEFKSRLHKIAALFPPDFQNDFVAAEQKAFKDLRELMCHARLLELAETESTKIARARPDMTKEVEEIEGKRAEKRAEVGVSLRWHVGIKIGLCLLFACGAFLTLRYHDRITLAEQKKQADMCPRCMFKGSDGKPFWEEKVNEIPNEKIAGPTYLSCVECGHEFPPEYLKHPRLCFPTVGVPGSGKTTWLISAYDLIKRNQVPVWAKLQNAPSAANDDFDVQVVRVLQNRRETDGTKHSMGDNAVIPSPLVFHLEDCDHLGRNEAMLNLFDFAGEMMDKHIKTDLLRRRALEMEGFVLFLDPTKVRASKGGQSLKDQIKALEKFHQEIRVKREVDVGTPIPVPIAVCISKLDLISTQNPFSQAALPWLKGLRDSFAKPVTLAEIQKRSKMCEQVIANLFPGWGLTRTLDEHFGGRFKFFPLTPIGLEEGSSAPVGVGVLEPILWLMHMHGFNIFGKGAGQN